jgi:hypothetical protein
MSEETPKKRGYIFNVEITVVLGMLVIVLGTLIYFKGFDFFINLFDGMSIIFITGFTAVFAVLTNIINGSLNIDSEVKLSQLKIDRDNITRKIESKDNLDIFHTIQLSLNQLDEYYTINKNQATTSFIISLTVITLGFVMLIVGISLNYYGLKNIPLTYLTGVSSILLEFIGGAYFFMYKKSLEQVNFFFGQLIRVQDTMLAIKLVEEVKDDNKKVEMTDKIIVSLLERSLK